MQILRHILSSITLLIGVTLSILNIKDGNIYSLILTILATLACILFFQKHLKTLTGVAIISLMLSLGYNVYYYQNVTLRNKIGGTFSAITSYANNDCVKLKNKDFVNAVNNCPLEAEAERINIIIDFIKSYHLPSPFAFMDHTYNQLNKKDLTLCEESLKAIKTACSNLDIP